MLLSNRKNPQSGATTILTMQFDISSRMYFRRRRQGNYPSNMNRRNRNWMPDKRTRTYPSSRLQEVKK